MNLKQLMFAQSVAQTKSFSQAAELCFVTQPTLSNGISQLEEELGGKLFVRTTRAVSLTAFGEYMLPYIEALLNDQLELQQAAKSYHNPEHQLLRFGFSPLVDMQVLDQALAVFKENHPKVSVFFKECLLDDLAGRLSKGQIDFAIVPSLVETNELSPNQTNEAWQSYFFYQQPLMYIPQDGSSSTYKRFQYKINELPPAPIILTGGACGLNASLQALFDANHANLNAYPGQAMSYSVIEQWADLGIGAGILPAGKVSKDNKIAQYLYNNQGEKLAFGFNWLWDNQGKQNPICAAFLDYLLSLENTKQIADKDIESQSISVI